MRIVQQKIHSALPVDRKHPGASSAIGLSGLRVGNNQRGFTLIELVMTMVVVSILAVYATSRFFDKSAFQSRGFADQVQAALRYAQKEAIAQRGFACVAFTATTISITTGTTNACSPPTILSVTAPSGITISPVPPTLYFNALGQPNAGAAVANVVVAGTIINIETETGYVHQ